MNLFDAFIKIEKTTGKKLTALDVKDGIGCICKGYIIRFNRIDFFIDTLELTDRLLLQALYNDICNNPTNYKDTHIFLMALQKIDISLYRLQKISRV